MNQIDLSERIAVITGGAQGIGYGIAERMLLSGAQVVLWDRNEATLREAVQALATKGVVSSEVVELGDEGSVQAAAARTLAAHKRIDI